MPPICVHLPPALLAVCAAVLLAGCGGTDTVKSSELVSKIDEQFAAQGIKLHDTQCPSDIKSETGAAIHCTARNAAGTKLSIDGTVGERNGDKYRFRVKITRGEVDGRRIAAQAKRALERQVGGRAKAMTCPKVVSIPTKPSVTCVLETLDGKRYDTTVIVPADGGLRVAVAQQPK